MHYVIGIEIGQNGTSCVIADENGCLMGIGHGGFNNHIGDEGGRDRLRHSLEDSIRAVLTAADLQNARLSSACVVGAGSDSMIENVCCEILQVGSLVIHSETRAALYASTLGKPGIAVFAGIGASAIARNQKNQERTVGGWGHPAGDEGSRTWIAQRALTACCRAADGLTPSTQILPLILQQFEVEDLHQLKALIQSRNRNRTEMISIAEIVSHVAAIGDPTALKILRDAGRELALLVTSLTANPGFGKSSFKVSAAGAVFRSGRLVLRSFREVIRQKNPSAEILPACAPLSMGAAILALEALQIEVDDRLIERVDGSLARIGASRC